MEASPYPLPANYEANQIYHQINGISFNIKNEVTQLCQSKPLRA